MEITGGTHFKLMENKVPDGSEDFVMILKILIWQGQSRSQAATLFEQVGQKGNFKIGHRIYRGGVFFCSGRYIFAEDNGLVLCNSCDLA